MTGRFGFKWSKDKTVLVVDLLALEVVQVYLLLVQLDPVSYQKAIHGEARFQHL